MTERPEPRPSAPTAPTEPVPPAASAAPAGPSGPAGPTVTTEAAPRRPWYRHVWVPVVGALVLVLLAFGSGFVAGQATSLFRVATVASGDGPAWGDGDRGDRSGMPGGRDGGPGWHDGGLPGQHGDTDTDSDTDTDTE
jgi:hypothetical protein